MIKHKQAELMQKCQTLSGSVCVRERDVSLYCTKARNPTQPCDQFSQFNVNVSTLIISFLILNYLFNCVNKISN